MKFFDKFGFRGLCVLNSDYHVFGHLRHYPILSNQEHLYMSIEPFKELANNKIVGLPDGNVFSWCPGMDLLAISMNKTSIWIFRVDGERVYSINNKAPILEFKWSKEGKYFVCSGEDRAVKVYDANTGTNLSSFITNPDLPISHISWHSFNSHIVKCEPTLNNLDLDLSNLNILNAMPKLSFECETLDLPQNIQKGTEISSNTYIRENKHAFEFILVINSNSSFSLIFCNTLVVPSIQLPKDLTYIKHVMGNDFFQQFFLVKNQANEFSILDCNIDIKEDLSKFNFIKVIELVVQMVSIINHINDHINSITKTANDFVSLFDRYLSNYKDSLFSGSQNEESYSLESIHQKMILDLSDILLTGLIPENTVDFWLNQFGVRGLVRLSSVGNAAYDSTRENLYAQVILAIEKLIIILTELESIAKAEQCFQESSIGISLESTCKTISQLKAFMKDVFDFIWKINEEQEQFNMFLNWCQVEVIEKLSKKDSDPSEFFRAHPTLDSSVSLIVDYIDKSILKPVFLQCLTLDTKSNDILLHPSPSFEKELGYHLRSAANEIQDLRSGFEHFVASAFKFKEPQKLSIPENSKVDYEMIDNKLFVSVEQGSQLLLFKFFEGTHSEYKIEFPSRIISSVILGVKDLLVLHDHGNGVFRLDYLEVDWNQGSAHYSDAKILKSRVFDATSFISKPALITVSSTVNKRQTVGVIVDSSKRMYSVVEV